MSASTRENGTPAGVHGSPTSNGTHSAKQVWVSLITAMSYLPGLLTLDFALKRVRSKYTLVALYTDSFPQEGLKALERRGIAMRHIHELVPAVDDIDYGNDPRFKDTWSKLAVFALEEFDKAILLDSDMLIRQNMDELMDVDVDPPALKGKGSRVFAAGHACTCNPWKKPHYPKDWVPSSCAFTAQHADPDAAQRSGMSNKLSHGMPNSGLVVCSPSREAYMAVLEKLRDEEAVRSYKFPDQALLADAFHERWVPLPYIYNALKTMRAAEVHGPIWRDDSVKNVHYIFSPKPWDDRRGVVDDALFYWWHDVNDERIAAEKSTGTYDGIGDTALLPADK